MVVGGDATHVPVGTVVPFAAAWYVIAVDLTPFPVAPVSPFRP